MLVVTNCSPPEMAPKLGSVCSVIEFMELGQTRTFVEAAESHLAVSFDLPKLAAKMMLSVWNVEGISITRELH
jgi:hypothetical protein